MILGLDISTSITGITIMDYDGKVLYNGYCDLKKQKDFFDKVITLRDKLEEVCNETMTFNSIKHIYVEESLQAFRAGFSSAATLSKLTKFNGVTQWIAFSLFNIKAEGISAASARKLAGITIKRNSKKAKEQVMDFMLDKVPSFVVEYTKHGNIKAHYYDMADSYVIARAGLELCQQKNLQS